MTKDVLFNKAKEIGFTDVELTIEKNEAMTVEVFESEVSKNEVHSSVKYTVRGIIEGKMASISFESEDMDDDSLLEVLKNNALVVNSGEENEIFEGSASYPELTKRNNNFQNVTTQEKINLLLDIEKKAKAYDNRIAIVEVEYEDSTSSMEIMNTKGLNIKKDGFDGAVVLSVVARDGNDSKSNYKVVVSNDYNEFNADKIVNEACEKVLKMFGAEPVVSKQYPVVFSKEMASTILGCFMSMFSGEMAMRKLCALLGKENTKIMDERITIVDNPCKDDAISRHPFDDEGVCCCEKMLVEKGIFKGLLHNLKTAKHFKTNSTGNGFKQGSNIVVKGHNMYLMPGTKTEDDLIRETEEGLYITSLQGLHSGVNPITGDFSAQASGFLIENGIITKPVTLIVVSGNYLKMMNDIADIANNLEIGYTGVGSPSIKVNALSISGK